MTELTARQAARASMRIAAAAVREENGTIHTLPPPARHADLIYGKGVMFQPHMQGFVTDCGQWASRRRALYIATRAKQLIGEPISPATGLFSEDVW